jgi:imidazolonepropionase-like amidohydrolase
MRYAAIALSVAAMVGGACSDTGTLQHPQARQSPSGLWDAHTHLTWYGEDALRLLAQAGVTSVRDCGGDVATLKRWRSEIAAGKRIGPHIYFSGPALDGPKDAKFRLTVNTPEEGRRAVDDLAAQGVDFIKTHNAISRDTYFAVIAEAHRKHLKVTSHLPKGVPAWEAADAGVDGVEHAAESLLTSPIYAGYAKDADEAMAWWRSPQGDAAIRRLAQQRVAVTPTLVTYQAFTEMRRDTPAYEGRQRVMAFLLELTGRMYRAGVIILAGSDFASPDLPLRPGQSLLDEIALLEKAGLPRKAALAAAGSNVANWLKH